MLKAALILGFGVNIPIFAQTLTPVIPLPPVRIDAVRFLSTPVMTTLAGSPYRYQVRTSTATAGVPVVYRLTTAPQGMTIDSTSGLVSWTPSSAATVRVGIRAAYATNASVNQTQNYGLTVLPQSAGQAMVRFTSTAPANANVGTPYTYLVRAFYGVDTRLAPETRPVSAMRYALLNAPQGMVLDASSGTIRWIPTTVGTVRFSVQAIATTLASATATQEVEIRVSQVMPQFFSQPAREAFVGQEYVYRAIASLPVIQARPATTTSSGGSANTDLARLLPAIFPGTTRMNYALVTAPQGMMIEATSGIVRWTPSATAASVSVSIRATVVGNTTQTVMQNFTLTARFPAVNFITQAPNQAALGQNYVYEPIAVVSGFPSALPIATLPVLPTSGSMTAPRDLVNIISSLRPRSTAGLVFSLVAAPQGMTIQSTNGVIRWTASSIGTFNVSIRATMATNAQITGVQNFAIRVNQPEARFITQPGSAFVNIGETFMYRAQAQIPGMTTATLRYSLETAPQGMTIDSVSGAIRHTPQFAGEFPVTVVARVAGQASVIARQNFTLYARPAVCAVLRGEVKYANTTATVQQATVRAVANGTSANVRSGGQLVYTATVRNGQFTIPVASGEYTLAVTGNDFNEVWWSNGVAPASAMASATPVTVRCGDSLTRTLSVTRRAPAKFFTLSGRVIRAANGAAAQATIEVLGDAPPEIARETQRRTVRTDTQGNYRIALDDRFTYILRALPDNANASIALPGTVSSTTELLPQYFTGSSGGSLNIGDARKITLTADIANINFMLNNRPVYANSLSGTLRSASGQAIAGRVVAFMTATTANTPQYASIDVRTEIISSAGTFSVSNLTPGEYVIQALPNDARTFSAAYYRDGTNATTLWRSATRLTVSATSNLRVAIVLPSRTSETKATTSLAASDENSVEISNDASSAALQTATGVRNQTPSAQMLLVAPNPASNLVSVSLPTFASEARLELFSLRGEELFRATLTPRSTPSSFPLDVSAVPTGMYLLRLSGADVRMSAQVLVQR
ncbi:MAG: hypothetical protein EAZ92_07250 [Candidatus Kapaibacterium sp.]|nr:MAG: hypothetical protein EAZ92_07250 [Candidatus Kapabacteria bacterium]